MIVLTNPFEWKGLQQCYHYTDGLNQNLRQLMSCCYCCRVLLLSHVLSVTLWTAINPEPSKQLIKNLHVVKDMGLLDLEKHLQLPDAPGSLGRMMISSQVSSARRLVNISRTLRAIDLKF
jgi:hypothetical protein